MNWNVGIRKALVSGGFVSGHALSRAEGSGERFGLQPLRTQESPSGFHLKPLATDTLRHDSSRALIRRPPPGFHFHVAHLHRPGASQTGLHLGYTDARGRGAAFAVPACPSAFGDGGQDVRHTGCQT